MRGDREIAVRLRLTGKSYSEIQKGLNGISKSTLSTWLKDIVLSDKARTRIAARTREGSLRGLLRRNKNQTRLAIQRKEAAMRSAQSEIKDISPRDLLLMGATLYWAEGHKRPIMKNGRELTSHSISLTNSDPKLVKVFLEFAIKICKVPIDKITANVRIFEHLNEENVLSYWARETNIPRKNFTKTYVGTSRSSMGKKPFNRLHYGVIQIRINNTSLFHRIMGWISGLKSKF